MVTLKASGADTFFNITTPKFAAQAIKKAAEIGWKPTHYLNSVSASVGSVLTPAGLENGDRHHHRAATSRTRPIRSSRRARSWDDCVGLDEEVQPERRHERRERNVYGYTVAQGLVQVLKQAGDNLTRENIMKQAASLDMTLPMLLPGVNVKTGPDDFYPIEREQLAKFDGKTWVLFGKVYGR